MAVKCTECGASIQDDSKFCKYCGAKIVLDQTKKIEVKIDNTAEIRRAEYEEKESKLRQIKMERELRKEKRKPYIIGLKILSVVVPFAMCSFVKNDSTSTIGLMAIGFIFFGFHVYKFLDK